MERKPAKRKREVCVRWGSMIRGYTHGFGVCMKVALTLCTHHWPPSWSLVTPLVGREGRKRRETIEKAEEGPKCPQEAIDSLHGVARRDQACTESKVPRSLDHRTEQEGRRTLENPGWQVGEQAKSKPSLSSEVDHFHVYILEMFKCWRWGRPWPSDLWVPKNGSNCLCSWSLRVKCCLVHVLHRCSQKWTEEAKRLKERYKEEMAEYQKTGAISTAATKSRWVGFGSFSPTDLLPFISQRATITHNLRAILFTLALYDYMYQYIHVDISTCICIREFPEQPKLCGRYSVCTKTWQADITHFGLVVTC